MKQIRYLAASLMLLTGVLHFIPLFTNFEGPNTLPMLAFGIGYLAVGYLLFKHKPIGTFLGVFLPLVGLGAGFLKIGFTNWDAFLTVLFAIDAIVVACCVLLLNKKK